MPLIFFFHTTTHVSLNRKRSACRFLLKQQKLLLQLDWLLPYPLLLQLLLKKQLLPSHALMLRLHLEPCWRLRWSQSSLARQKRARGCGPSEGLHARSPETCARHRASEDSALAGFGQRNVFSSLQSFTMKSCSPKNQSPI